MNIAHRLSLDLFEAKDRQGLANRIFFSIAQNTRQAQGRVLDLTRSSVSRDQLRNMLARVNDSGDNNIQDIVIMGAK